MKILVACEQSGRVRDAFKALGHDAWSCDILPTDSPGQHLQCDITTVLNNGWDLMVAHPPCTYMANSGVSWLHKDPTRWGKLDEAAVLFKLLMDAPIQRICIENPIMHKYAKERIGWAKQSQIIQPWMFGHMEKPRQPAYGSRIFHRSNPPTSLKAVNNASGRWLQAQHAPKTAA